MEFVGWDGAAGVQGCPQVTPLPCGVPRCEVDTASGTSVGCEASPKASSGNTTQLLFANGGFELWARRSGAYGLVRNSAVVRQGLTKHAGRRSFDASPAFSGVCLHQRHPAIVGMNSGTSLGF
jgi:hypothetical protein